MRIDRVDSEAELLGPPVSNAEIVKVVAGDFEVRLAQTAAEIEAAQALRFRVFYEEMAAHASPEMKALGRDFDPFDEVCDHLLVLDRRRGEGPEGIVGTYRLIRRSAALKMGRFYSSAEYDIQKMIDYPGEVLELGRSCIAKDARNTATMQMLWRGIALYAYHYNIQVMFGCASLPGVDPEQHAQALSYLYHHHLAPPDIRVRALPSRYVKMDMLEPGSYDPAQGDGARAAADQGIPEARWLRRRRRGDRPRIQQHRCLHHREDRTGDREVHPPLRTRDA